MAASTFGPPAAAPWTTLCGATRPAGTRGDLARPAAAPRSTTRWRWLSSGRAGARGSVTAHRPTVPGGQPAGAARRGRSLPSYGNTGARVLGGGPRRRDGAALWPRDIRQTVADLRHATPLPWGLRPPRLAGCGEPWAALDTGPHPVRAPALWPRGTDGAPTRRPGALPAPAAQEGRGPVPGEAPRAVDGGRLPRPRLPGGDEEGIHIQARRHGGARPCLPGAPLVSPRRRAGREARRRPLRPLPRCPRPRALSGREPPGIATQRTRPQGEGKREESFSVEPGEIGLAPLEEAGDGIDQDAKSRLAQLAAGLAER